MNIISAISQLDSVKSTTQSIFKQLDSYFPVLLAKNEKSSFHELKDAISTIDSTVLSDSKSLEDAQKFREKYNSLSEQLNQKIKDLESLNNKIADIKEDSEQMSLIALNAMVISVKSGEKGLAFSRITENLQRLSKDMFIDSDKLKHEENLLLQQINILKSILSGITAAQNAISSKSYECVSGIRKLSANAGSAISDLSDKSERIYPAIQRAMTVLDSKSQLDKDFQNIASILKEFSQIPSPHSGSDSELDYLTFGIGIYQLVCDSLFQLSSTVSYMCSSFAGNWSEVIEILESTDGARMDFESRFLNKHAFGNDNIENQLNSITKKFQEMLTEFSNYHLVQKDLQSVCESILEHGHSIFSVFESLRPVMNQLHHVRILQQIEVAKNEAIMSVQNSVTDMDHLISSANLSLDEMQGVLENFIHDINIMLGDFDKTLSEENKMIFELRSEREVEFGDLQNGKAIVESAGQNFGVYSDAFQKNCVVVQQNLQDLMRLNMDIGSFSNDIESEKSSLFERKNSLLEEKGLSEWQIQDSKLLSILNSLKATL